VKGRKPKPTGLKRLAGNPGKRKLNEREPNPKPEIPTCPAHLMPTAKAEWKRLVHELYDLGVLSRLDRAALAGYCQAYGRWVEAETKLKETPAILKMPSGYIQQNPWLTIATKQMELMQRFAAELGMTPSSRSRVEIIRRPKEGEFYLNSRGLSARFSTERKPWEIDCIE
jgi:P27 family predicted phage terminase small subunit